MRAPFAPPRMSVPRNVEADAQAVRTSSDTVSPESRIFGLQLRDVRCINQLVIDSRDRVLPKQLFGRSVSTDVACTRAHVAMRQLEPGLGEGDPELFGIFRNRFEILR